MADSTVQSTAIVLADDHAMVRSGLRLLLESTGDLRVVAEAGDIDEALRHTKAERPRIAVLDLNMPGRSTLDAIPGFLASAPETAIIVLTMEADPVFARRALNAGASGYVLKEGADAELVDAVRAVAAGQTYVTPKLGARLATMPTAPEESGGVDIGVGAMFAGHRIDAIVGRGGMGVVYRATDLTLDRPVALKVIAPSAAADPTFRARFDLECRAAAAIDHPHAVPVFRAGEDRGLLYLTMRYIDGIDLRSLLHDQGRLAPLRSVILLAQVAGALEQAHHLGIVHRDVKPANVLISKRDGGEHAFLTDFGVTKRPDTPAELTDTGQALGTADYMAPEQVTGEDVDARADIYSLGCVLFHMLTGEPPHRRETELKTLWSHVHEPAPSLLDTAPHLPQPLAPVLSRALAKNPARRQRSAATLAREALTAVGGGGA